MSAVARAAYSYRADPAVPSFPDDRPIVVFDGYCALCTGCARFVLRHDPAAKFRLLAAQSTLGHALYEHYGLDPQDDETTILIADGIAWFKSEAAIRIAESLGWPWSVIGCLRVCPRSARDVAYDVIARNRLRLFGRRTSCYAPAAGARD